MKYTSKVIALLLLLNTMSSVLQCAAAQSSVEGTWRVIFTNRNLKATFVLNQVETKLMGTWTIDGATPQSLEGMIVGDSLRLVGEQKENNGKLLISTFSGKVISNEMRGNLSFQWEGGNPAGTSQPWTAERITVEKDTTIEKNVANEKNTANETNTAPEVDNEQEPGLGESREDKERIRTDEELSAQGSTYYEVTSLAKKLNSVVHRYESYGYSGVVLVSKDGIPVLNEGYGFANRVLGVENDPHIYFDLASITKQFTSATIFLLEEQGRLSTDDTLLDHFPDVPSDKAKITIQQLLDHTSGITKVPRPLYYQIDRKDLIDAIFDIPLRTQPGTSFDYENENYNLLASIVERVSEQPFNSFLSTHFFEPKGMDRISFEPKLTPNVLASQYIGSIDAEEAVLVREGAFRHGAGGAKATAKGLHQWIEALTAGEILSEESLAKLWKGPDDEQSSYHNAWSHRTTDFGSQVIEVAGDLEGFQHQLQYYPAEDLVVIVLSNTRVNGFQWRERVADDMGRVATGHKSLMPLGRNASAQSMDVVAGEYVSGNGNQLVIEHTGKATLKLSGSGQSMIDFFNSTHTKNRPVIDELNNRLKEATAQLASGETVHFESFMSDKTKARFQRDWHGIQNNAGDLVQYQLLGSIPNGPFRYTTLMKYDFERGDPLTVRFYWDGNHENLVGWWAKPYEPAITRWFYAVDEYSWASFDPLSDEQVIMTMSNDKNNSPSLVLTLPSKTIRASLQQN